MATEQPRPNREDVFVCGACANRWGGDAWANDCPHAAETTKALTSALTARLRELEAEVARLNETKMSNSRALAEMRVGANAMANEITDLRFRLAAAEAAIPVPMLLFCPSCGRQHVDAPEAESGWTNPPHKSHKCHACGLVWRPADVPTNGVATIETRGSADTWNGPSALAAPAAIRALAPIPALDAAENARLRDDLTDAVRERAEAERRVIEAARAWNTAPQGISVFTAEAIGSSSYAAANVERAKVDRALAEAVNALAQLPPEGQG